VLVTETILGDTKKLDLGEAPVIISGGRGLKAPEHFALVEALAAAFGNAAVGATRAVTDEGWRPHSDQIGQTGRLVSPSASRRPRSCATRWRDSCMRSCSGASACWPWERSRSSCRAS
jgi:hypothetical protein